MKTVYALFMSAVMVITGCGGGGSDSASQAIAETPALVSISITPTKPRVLLGTTIKLTATALYSDGSTPDITALARWRSENEAAATVGGGVVETKGVGSARITAELNGIPGATDVAVIGPFTVSGTQLDTNGDPVAGAAVTMVANSKTYQTLTDEDGNYSLTISAEDADKLPANFSYTISKIGFNPVVYTVTKGTPGHQGGGQLPMASILTVVLDPVPVWHHLGDEFDYKFQAPANEGLTYTYHFDLASQPSDFRFAYVSFTHRGVETAFGFLDKMIINSHTIDFPDSDATLSQSVMQMDASNFLSNQQNTLTMQSATVSGGDDFDDFEFVNIQITFGN